MKTNLARLILLTAFLSGLVAVGVKYFDQVSHEPVGSTNGLREVVGAGRTRTETPHLTLTTWLNQDRAELGDRLTMFIDIELPDRMHIYAPEVEGYIPVEFSVADNSDVLLHEVRFPEPEVLYLEAIQERVPVYHDTVQITQDFTLAEQTESDTLQLSGVLAYQACNDEICFLPANVPVSFTLEIASPPAPPVSRD